MATEQSANRTATARQIRAVSSILGLLALAWETYAGYTDNSNVIHNPNASAVQVIQLWTPHIFYALAIVGFMIGCYIFSRVWD